MIVIHLRQHVYSVGIEGQVWALHDPQSIELVTESSLSKHKLSSIGSVQTVYAVGSTYAVLQ